MKTIFALAVILATPAASEQPIEVSVCELAGHAERYHSQIVAVQAMFDLDQWILYDADCAGRDDWISVEDVLDSETRLMDRISGSLSGVVEGRFVGRFLGPNGYGYSHLGTKRTELQVSEVSQLRRVEKPSLPDADAPAPYLALRQAIEELNWSWMPAVTGRDTARLREILSPDYVAILPNGEMLAGPQAIDALALPHQKAIEALSAEGTAPDRTEARVLIFSIDLQTAVASLHVSLIGRRNAAAGEWEYLNIYRKVDSQWRLAFSQFIRVDSHHE